MQRTFSRRSFFSRSAGLGAGAFLMPRGLIGGNRSGQAGQAGQVPMIASSHANQTGRNAVAAGYEILAGGGSALDAVETAANIVEDDPEDMSVGYGGAPNEAGVVQLDASIMDGRTYNAGAVGCLENIRHPCSVARIVMEHTDHVLLVGSGALAFAKKWGFEEENLLTERARLAWLRWRENLNESDHWGPPEHLRDRPDLAAHLNRLHPEEYHHGTVNLLAVDTAGNVAGITTTSGYASKIPGRVGDSPIIGAGLYVDNEVGAAGAVGRGEDVIKTCSTFYIVLRMAQGRSPQQACLDALEMIVARYRNVNPDYFPGEHFVAVNRAGETGCAAMHGRARMAVATGAGVNLTEGPGLR